ncbi:MAG: hypothetical protein JJU06_16725 [Ectothiorhodospiraceae bacterium]|nr:hypothetical protein [Ectothiorhodospiraceae bacterium]MCH8503816.1 hypothetical protein [Ectothiorhodospiraceae bacterium]
MKRDGQKGGGAAGIDVRERRSLPASFLTWLTASGLAGQQTVQEFARSLTKRHGCLLVASTPDHAVVGVMGVAAHVEQPRRDERHVTLRAEVALFGVKPGDHQEATSEALVAVASSYFHEQAFKVLPKSERPVLMTLMGHEVFDPLWQPMQGLRERVSVWAERYPRLTLNEWEISAAGTIATNRYLGRITQRLIDELAPKWEFRG